MTRQTHTAGDHKVVDETGDGIKVYQCRACPASATNLEALARISCISNRQPSGWLATHRPDLWDVSVM